MLEILCCCWVVLEGEWMSIGEKHSGRVRGWATVSGQHNRTHFTSRDSTHTQHHFHYIFPLYISTIYFHYIFPLYLLNIYIFTYLHIYIFTCSVLFYNCFCVCHFTKHAPTHKPTSHSGHSVCTLVRTTGFLRAQ